MHPIVAAMAASAAASFGKEIGEQAAKALFSSFRNQDSKAAAAELQKIRAELQRINQKLDTLISAVAHLPGVILRGVGELHVEAAYDQIEGQRLSFITQPTDPVSREELQLAASQWLTIVRLEDRPTKLMLLPDYTQYVRAAFANAEEPSSIDKTLREHLSEKKRKIDEQIKYFQDRTDRIARKIEQIWTTHYAWDWLIFTNYGFKETEPYIYYSYIDNPKPQREGPLKIPTQPAFDARVQEVHNVIDPAQKKYVQGARMLTALLMVQLMLDKYIANLTDGGTVEAINVSLPA
jgi:hypothetical protein